MSDPVSEQADRRLAEALAASGARDPREFYRERLRELREENSDRYDEAVVYYSETLLPSIASGAMNPLHAWTEYGRRLAVALAPGETVRVDESGLNSHGLNPPTVRAGIAHVGIRGVDARQG